MLLQKICDAQGLPYVVDITADSSLDLDSKSIVQVQLAITMLEIALADLWKHWGIRPGLLIGHSLGEYSPLYVAGVLSASDKLYLVGKRSSLIQAKSDYGAYGMLAIRSPSKVVEEHLAAQSFPSCQLACVNAPNSTVVSGKIADLKSLQDYL